MLTRWCLLMLILPHAAMASTPERRTLSSPWQPVPVSMDILVPDRLEAGTRYPVLYILPVEPQDSSRWGSGMDEAVKADLANRYGVICVAPGFAATPWFADHPSDPALQQESHFLKVVLPWVEAHYPANPTRSGRFLLGFSKSGYGAVMLLLRHPDVFERAVAWDAPIDKQHPDQFRMIDVFGTDEHFQQYAIPRLLDQHAAEFQNQPARIFLMPNRDGDHAMSAVHEKLTALGIPHTYEFTEHIKHHWASGWVPRAADLVLSAPETRQEPEAPAPISDR